MSRYTARSNCLFRSRAARSAGYALIVLMMAITVLLISLTTVLPSIYQESQRHREEEAIFCGGQYARAIYLFHRRMGRFPVSVKDLLRTDNIRFLRQPYRDPLSRDGRWRFIHASAGGILIDSWNQTALTNNPSAGSAHNSAFGQTSNPAPNQATNPESNPISTNGSAAFDDMGSSGSSGGSGGKGKPKHPPSTCSGPLDQTEGSSQQTGTLLGAFIVGVAPCNDRQSIRVLEQEDHYDHWEFLGLNYPVYRLPRATTPNSLQPLQSTPPNPMGFPGPGGTSNGQGMPPANQGVGQPNSP